MTTLLQLWSQMNPYLPWLLVTPGGVVTTWHDASPPVGSEIAPIRDTRDEDSAGRSGMVSCFDCNYSTVALCSVVRCCVALRHDIRGGEGIGPGWISARPVRLRVD